MSQRKASIIHSVVISGIRLSGMTDLIYLR